MFLAGLSFLATQSLSSSPWYNMTYRETNAVSTTKKKKKSLFFSLKFLQFALYLHLLRSWFITSNIQDNTRGWLTLKCKPMLLSGFLVRTKKLSTLHVSMHGLLSHSCTFTKDTAAVSAIRGGAFPGDAVQSWSSPCQLWNQLATKIHTFSKDAAFPKNRGSRLLQIILSLVTSILLHVSPTAMTSPFPNLFHNPVASCYPPVVPPKRTCFQLFRNEL